MTYDVFHGPFRGEVAKTERKPPGRKSRYPLVELAVGSGLIVPFEEARWIHGAVRYARRAYGVRCQVAQEAVTLRWVVTRVE